MKLDIQGFESRAFRGAGGLLRWRAVDVFIIEFDPVLQHSQGGSWRDLLETACRRLCFFEGAVISHRLQYAAVHNSLGKTLGVHEYVDMLRKLGAYTDLVAVRYELVPHALIDGYLLEQVHSAGGRRGNGRGVLAQARGEEAVI